MEIPRMFCFFPPHQRGSPFDNWISEWVYENEYVPFKKNYGFGGPCWGDPLSKYHGTIQALEKSQNNGHGNAWN